MIAAVGPAPRLNNELIWKRTFGENFENRQHAIEVFERHNEEVKSRGAAGQAVPAPERHRLLSEDSSRALYLKGLKPLHNTLFLPTVNMNS
jgi:hypothetical protein